MPFTSAEIRRGMDVYDGAGRWLGSVLRVDLPAAPLATYPISSAPFSGEELGPAPTAGIGNTGPAAQAAAGRRAGAAGQSVAGLGTFEFGRWLGLAGRRRVSVERVINVSISRVVVDLG